MNGVPIPAGGYAFPHKPEQRQPIDCGFEQVIPGEHPGMELRDYFAAKAMQGLMGRAWGNPVTGALPDDLFTTWATSAYQVADAMIKARAS